MNNIKFFKLTQDCTNKISSIGNNNEKYSKIGYSK